MTELTRRRMLGGAGATGAALALAPLAATSVQAAAPPSGKQVAGIYRYKVGSYECTSVADGVAQFPFPKNWVRNVPDAQAQAAAEAAYMPKGMVRVPFNPQLINTGSKLILIDTGVGPSPTNPRVGQLMANLAAAGVDPKSVDMVIMSHLHPDHTNGIKTADGGLAFPNAEILVPAQDWAFWMSDENAAKAESNPMMKNYFANVRRVYANVPASRVTKYEWGKEVAPGITAVDASGHTPGHTAFAVASGNARIFLQSDITNIPQLFLRNPEWHVAFDIDAPKAVQTRRKFYDMVSAEKAVVVGFHFPFPSIGHVEKDGANYRLVPIAWDSAI
jgi:glyoxylase-like metal-dependent hydrolase (beta-lactamase superfamily II)